MTTYHSIAAKLIKMLNICPVFNDDEELIGHTQLGDMAIITYEDKNSDYYEATIVSGKFAGIDNLAFNRKQLKDCVVLFNEAVTNGQEVNIKGYDIKTDIISQREKSLGEYIPLHEQEAKYAEYYLDLNEACKTEEKRLSYPHESPQLKSWQDELNNVEQEFIQMFGRPLKEYFEDNQHTVSYNNEPPKFTR